jgi:hypothetical protein
MTYKKLLALMLCSLFAVGKSSALCCFSKKAVPRPSPAENADKVALNAVHYWVEEIKRLNSVVSRIVREPEERGRAQHNLRQAVKEVKSNKAYRGFIEEQNGDVLWQSETQFYADDKEVHDRAIEAAWPELPKGLSALITDYLWQEGNEIAVYVYSESKDTERVVIIDKNNKHHVLTSSATRAVFDSKSISSLRFMAPHHLRALALLRDVQPKSEDLAVRAWEDESLEKFMQKYTIKGRVAELARRRQLWVVPAVDDSAQEQKIDA